MSEQDDQIFLKRFSLVITGLAIFAVLIIFLAIEMDERIVDSANPSHEIAKVERIRPMFDVYIGEAPARPDAAGQAVADAGTGAAQPRSGDGQAADATQQSAGQTSAGEQQVAAADIDGEQIYNNACQACHMAGAAGAPQLVAEQWTERLDKGMDTLVSHAINGFNAMPAKGGRTDLSDAEVRASVEYMVSQVR